MRYFLTAIALLSPLSMLAVVLSWPGFPLNPLTGQLENLYGFLGLAGVVSFAIVGMLYKIVPFLVWLGVYSQEVGRAQVPTLAELYSERLQIAGYIAYLAGLTATGVAIVLANQPAIQVGCGTLGVSLLALVGNVALMLKHFLHPQLRPLAIRAAAIPAHS
jgi:hypothetical protein